MGYIDRSIKENATRMKEESPSKTDLVKAFLSASEDYRVRNVHRFEGQGFETDAFHKLITSAVQLELIDNIVLQRDFGCLPGDLERWQAAEDMPRRNLRRRIMSHLRQNALNFLRK